MTSNPGLELANPGIIEKVAPLYGIEKVCGGVDLMGFCLSARSIGHFKPHIVDTLPMFLGGWPGGNACA